MPPYLFPLILQQTPNKFAVCYTRFCSGAALYRSKAMKYILIGLIKLYRITLSERLPRLCRFTPSCSQYALTAVSRFGAVKGGFLAFWRICRCNPYSAGGWDPVPEEFYFFRSLKKHFQRKTKNKKTEKTHSAPGSNAFAEQKEEQKDSRDLGGSDY